MRFDQKRHPMPSQFKLDVEFTVHVFALLPSIEHLLPDKCEVHALLAVATQFDVNPVGRLPSLSESALQLIPRRYQMQPASFCRLFQRSDRLVAITDFNFRERVLAVEVETPCEQGQ